MTPHLTDIREILQRALHPGALEEGATWLSGRGLECPGPELDDRIADELGVDRHKFRYSVDRNAAIEWIESRGYDWIMGNVNGHMGGTPWACVGVTEDRASYSATPLLSLWLSYFRLEMGDERENA